MSPLSEVVRALVLVIGMPIAFSFFFVGWRIYKTNPGDYKMAQSMKKKSFAVDLRTNTFVEISTLSEEAIDIMLGAG